MPGYHKEMLYPSPEARSLPCNDLVDSCVIVGEILVDIWSGIQGGPLSGANGQSSGD